MRLHSPANALPTNCRSFECVGTNTPLSKWQEENGCVSAFSVDSKAWPALTSGRPFIASIYQQQVMIVEATVRPIRRACFIKDCADKLPDPIFGLTSNDAAKSCFRSCAPLCTNRPVQVNPQGWWRTHKWRHRRHSYRRGGGLRRDSRPCIRCMDDSEEESTCHVRNTTRGP
jgi:hypothetical protein